MSYLAQRNISRGAEVEDMTPDNLTVKFLPRFLARGEAIKPSELDQDGLGVDVSLCLGDNLDIERVMSVSRLGGIIVGEGDSGKTCFAQGLVNLSTDKMRVRVFRLREYVGDLGRLRCDAFDFAGQARETAHCFLVLDGLDENSQAWATIDSLCQAFLRSLGPVHIWVTSRPIDEVYQLAETNRLRYFYHLRPLTVPDVQRLAQHAGVDGRAFVSRLKTLGLTSVAAKPGGAVLLLELFRRGTLSGCMVDIVRDVVKAYVRSSRDGKIDSSSRDKVSENDLFDCAAWMATCMFFEQKDSVWDGSYHTCPASAIPLADLVRGEYTHVKVSCVLNRRLFEPLSKQRYRFVCDELLVPFLVACWLNVKSAGNLNGVLETRHGIGVCLGAILPWLARFQSDQAEEWIQKNPICFLESPEVVGEFGVGKYYNVLWKFHSSLSWYDQISFYESAGKRLLRLGELGEFSLGRLSCRKVSASEACFAATLVVRAGNLPRAVDGLVDFFVSHSLSDREKFRVLHALLAMVGDSRPASLGRLKPAFMSRTVPERDEDSLLGRYLTLLFPEHLALSELLARLCVLKWWTRDQRLADFLIDLFVKKRHSLIPREDAASCLNWAASILALSPYDDMTGVICGSIGTICWKWCDDPDAAAAFAACVNAGLDNANRLEISHRLAPFDTVFSGACCVGRYDWMNARERRFGVLLYFLSLRKSLVRAECLYVLSATRLRVALVYWDELDALMCFCKKRGVNVHQTGSESTLSQVISFLSELQDATFRRKIVTFEKIVFGLSADLGNDPPDVGELMRTLAAESWLRKPAKSSFHYVSLFGADSKEAERLILEFNAIDPCLYENVMSDVDGAELMRLVEIYLRFRRKYGDMGTYEVTVQFINDGVGALLSIARSRLMKESPAKFLSILREDLKAHPDDAELKDLCLTVERRLVDRLPPKLVHPELLDVWAGVPGVAVSRVGMSKGTASRVGRNSEHTRIQLRAVKCYLDKTKPRQWSVNDITIQVVSHLWKLNRSEWDAWKRDKTGFASIESLHQGVKRRFIEGKL